MQMKENEIILQAIKEGNFIPVSYFTYPTGTVGTSYIFEQNSHPDTKRNEEDQKLYEAVENAFDIVADILDIKKDNKTALKIMVEGIDKPVYLSSYDWKHAICYEISMRDGKEIPIPQPQPEMDPIKLVEESTDLNYLTMLSGFVDKDIEGINNDVNKSIDIRLRKLSEEQYQETKKKRLEWFHGFKEKIENRITQLKKQIT